MIPRKPLGYIWFLENLREIEGQFVYEGKPATEALRFHIMVVVFKHWAHGLFPFLFFVFNALFESWKFDCVRDTMKVWLYEECEEGKESFMETEHKFEWTQ